MITSEQYKTGSILKSDDGKSLIMLVRKNGEIHLMWLDPDSFMFKVSTDSKGIDEFRRYTYLTTLDESFCIALHNDFGLNPQE